MNGMKLKSEAIRLINEGDSSAALRLLPDIGDCQDGGLLWLRAIALQESGCEQAIEDREYCYRHAWRCREAAIEMDPGLLDRIPGMLWPSRGWAVRAYHKMLNDLLSVDQAFSVDDQNAILLWCRRLEWPVQKLGDIGLAAVPLLATLEDLKVEVQALQGALADGLVLRDVTRTFEKLMQVIGHLQAVSLGSTGSRIEPDFGSIRPVSACDAIGVHCSRYVDFSEGIERLQALSDEQVEELLSGSEVLTVAQATAIVGERECFGESVYRRLLVNLDSRHSQIRHLSLWAVHRHISRVDDGDLVRLCESVQGVLESDRSYRVRREAVVLLGEIAARCSGLTGSVLQSVVPAFGDVDPDVRLAAIDAASRLSGLDVSLFCIMESRAEELMRGVPKQGNKGPWQLSGQEEVDLTVALLRVSRQIGVESSKYTEMLIGLARDDGSNLRCVLMPVLSRIKAVRSLAVYAMHDEAVKGFLLERCWLDFSYSVAQEARKCIMRADDATTSSIQRRLDVPDL